MRRISARFSPLLLCLLLIGAAFGDEPARTHEITIDDYFSLGTLTSCALSPDSSQVAYTEARWQLSTEDRKADLWLVSTRGGPARRLTFDRANDRAVTWSSDGRFLYFLGNRKREAEKRPPHDGSTQVWRISQDGGEPTAVTRVEGGVQMYSLSDGAVWYVTESDHVEEEWREMRERFRDVEYGHGTHKVSRVWRLDLATWRTEKVIDEKRHIRELTVTPDGRRAAMITAPDEKVLSFEGRSTVDVWDAKTKKVSSLPDDVFRKQAPTPYGWLEHVAIDDSGTRLAFNVIFDAYPAEIVVAHLGDKGDIRVSKVARPDGLSVRGYGTPLAWGRGHKLSFLGERKGRVPLCVVEISEGTPGEVQVVALGDVVVQNFHVNREGRAACILGTPTALEEVYFLEKSERRRLTDVNAQTRTWKIPQLSIVSWKGANGVPVEGILELPPDAKKGQKLPLIVSIHGGPTTADLFAMQFWIYGRTLLPAKGYAVFCPNYRGSTGYGDKFLTDLVGRENDLDVQDILSGVDALIARGIADPERLGVMGWSNGGYLTNCIITRDRRFKAASSGAGIVDAVMEWGANDEPAYTMALKKGLPWTAAANYHRASPTYALDKVRTPTLIHVGGNDERCPPGHSRLLHRALKEYVHVPTELIVYPGEAHGLMKPKNRRAKMEWDLAWFDRYILGKGSP